MAQINSWAAFHAEVINVQRKFDLKWSEPRFHFARDVFGAMAKSMAVMD